MIIAKTPEHDLTSPRRLAYGILCHQSARFVEEQFALLYNPENYYFYHVDAKAPGLLMATVERLASTFPNVMVVPSRICSWGGFSLVEAMLSLVRWAMKVEPCTHFVFLSEQHLPLAADTSIKASLAVGTSYLDATRWFEKDARAQADILQRFGKHVELPGVGGFPMHSNVTTPEPPDRLSHGSQWMVLSFDAYAALAEEAAGNLFADFSSSILADETAIQTWFGRNQEDRGWRVVQRNMTFVSAPADGGSPDMIFSERNFFEAINRGCLFIRKRPEELPERVKSVLAGFAGLQMRHSERRIAGPVRPSLGADAILACLNSILCVGGEDRQLLLMPRNLVDPAFFCVWEQQSRHGCALFVVSADLLHFKVAVVSTQPSDDYSTVRIGGIDSSLLKVRAKSLWYHREFHMGDDLPPSFVMVETLDGLSVLARTVAAYQQRLCTVWGS